MVADDVRREPTSLSLGESASVSWDDVRAFLAVAVHGSMTAAASAVGASQATISRKVLRLEQQLGLALTQRDVNRTRLTRAGTDLFRMVSPMISAAAEIETIRRLHAKLPDSPVRITATTSVSMFLSRSLPQLRKAMPPSRELLLLPSRRIFDLERGEADIALRMRSVASEKGLLARKLGVVGYGVYGIADNARLPMIMSARKARRGSVPALSERGAEIRGAGPEIDEMHLRYIAAKAGVGVAGLPCWLADGDSDLVRLNEHDELDRLEDIFLVRHERTRGDDAIEAAVRALQQLFREHAALLRGRTQRYPTQAFSPGATT